MPSSALPSSALPPAEDAGLAAAVDQLTRHGVVQVPGRWPDAAAAWRAARQITSQAYGLDPWCARLPGLEVVGEFTLPPLGTMQRDFQALHIDYGVPRLAGPPVAVSRYTALYVDQPGSGTATRIVPLRALLSQRRWPDRGTLTERLCAGAGPDALVEGIFARIIESADQSTDLPDREADGFLCGMEFATLDEEHRYFARHGVPLTGIEQEVVLSGGELLLFDNVAVAHGRRGRRHSGELHQLCIGFGELDLAGQRVLLDRILTAFGASGA